MHKMVFFKWNELNDASEFIGSQMARGTKQFGCQLWNKYPKNFVGNNPVGSIIRGFWNSICSPATLPPPPPFIGGQCPVSYTVRTLYTVLINGSPNPNQPANASVQGKIYGVRNVGNSLQISCDGAPQSYPNMGGNWYQYGNIAGGDTSTFKVLDGSLRIDYIVRPDGQPDNCGNPPGGFPDVPPPAPGNETYNINITNNNDGDNKLTIPLIWNEIDFKVPLKFKFDGGTASLNFDGIDINFDDNNSIHIENSVTSLSNSVSVISENTSTLLNLYLLDKEPLPLDDLDKEEEEDVKEKEEINKDLVAIKIDVIKPPIDRMIILADDASDSTFFAGYFCWLLNGSRSAEIPVRKFSNIFVKPSWAEGYRFFALNQAKVKISTFTKPLTNESNNSNI